MNGYLMIYFQGETNDYTENRIDRSTTLISKTKATSKISQINFKDK